jgi:hypothetical protein
MMQTLWKISGASRVRSRKSFMKMSIQPGGSCIVA